MGFKRGPNAITVTSSMIYGISLYEMVATESLDVNGSFVFSGYKTAAGCSSSSVFIELKDTIQWNRIACRFIINGVAACWSFNDIGSWSGGPGPASGYLLQYDTSAGDHFSEERFTLNSWEKPQFKSHWRTGACDNDSNNFYHPSFQTGDPKTFFMRRRRDTSGNRAGIYHSSACQSSGTGHNITIRDIKIWYEG
jgi:hypothetical protein